MTRGGKNRRTSLRWGAGELDRLLRAVRLEDVTPPVERFGAIADSLERSPASVRAKWLELRNAALRGQPAASPAVAAYVRRRFPASARETAAEDRLDALVAEYREAQRQANALLERVFALAARDGEALERLRGTLFGYAAAASAEPPAGAEQPAAEAGALPSNLRSAA